MKKFCFIALLLLALTANAQHQINSFFTGKGAVRLETQELDTLSKQLAFVDHRADDVVWSRIVYRVIDMRYKQNYQLYFPINSDDPQYRSLFKVVVDAIIDGMPVYERPRDGVMPLYENPDGTSRLLTKAQIPATLTLNEMDADIYGSDDMILNYDSIEDNLRFQEYKYKQYVRNQLKWMIQELVFFDKHYSRLYTKIIAIAPMSYGDLNEVPGEEVPITTALNRSLRFWILYDDLRPYLARQYVIPQSNDTRRVTFEQFFAEKLYTSYLIGDANMYDRLFSDYAERMYPELRSAESEDEDMGGGYDEDEEEGEAVEPAENPAVVAARQKRKADIEKALKREQQRIQDELMNFEIDLWEY